MIRSQETYNYQNTPILLRSFALIFSLLEEAALKGATTKQTTATTRNIMANISTIDETLSGIPREQTRSSMPVNAATNEQIYGLNLLLEAI